IEHGLFIDGRWRAGSGGNLIDVVDPATEAVVATVPVAGIADLEEAVQAASRSFPVWAARPAPERGKMLREAARLIRERRDAIALLLTGEQGKPLREAVAEVDNAADIMEWYAE